MDFRYESWSSKAQFCKIYCLKSITDTTFWHEEFWNLILENWFCKLTHFTQTVFCCAWWSVKKRESCRELGDVRNLSRQSWLLVSPWNAAVGTMSDNMNGIKTKTTVFTSSGTAYSTAVEASSSQKVCVESCILITSLTVCLLVSSSVFSSTHSLSNTHVEEVKWTVRRALYSSTSSTAVYSSWYPWYFTMW